MNQEELKAYEMQANTSFILGYVWSRLNMIRDLIHPHDRMHIDNLLDELTPKMNKYYYPEIKQDDKPIAE